MYTYRLQGAPPVAMEEARTQLQGARAICYHDGTILCASGWGDTLWQLDARTLAPRRVTPLGPGVNRILCAQDGTTLYALCEDADSVISVSIKTGQPLFLARAGMQPRDMMLRENQLLVAGGAACEAQIFSTPTLELITRVPTQGMCVGAAFCGRHIGCFTMDEQAMGALWLHDENGRRREWMTVSALPGGLCSTSDGLWTLYWGGATLVNTGIERTFFMEGLAERAAAFPGGVIFCQPSTPQCLLLTAQGAQVLNGGCDVCVYETAAL